ncbi:hypothetical protein [Haloarcula sp. JP-L23]|uniref:hypothetical protein n=1 Tax=Haloarcula sp. JP-L23 TaxID=2716717 RepID=UPI00140F3A66|nr:hypothetical protein G9465_19495 [Haloarcula sp. JP-L23]
MSNERAYPLAETLSIDVAFDNANSAATQTVQQIYGGVKVAIDGHELTRFESQDALESEFNQDFEYKGEYPLPILRNFSARALEFARGDVDPTKSTESRIELYDGMGYIVLSWLNTSRVRIGFQTVPIGAAVEPTVPIRSAVGFAVKTEDLVQAVLEANEDILDYIDSSEIQKGETVRDFEQTIAELREVSYTGDVP